VHHTTRDLRIAIVGKYVATTDAYLSVTEALRHAGFALSANVHIERISSEQLLDGDSEKLLHDLDGVIIPGGFGERGLEGMVAAARFAREHSLPCLGICLGLQTMVIEFARNCLGLGGANSTEMDPSTPHPVISLMSEQTAVSELGATMRKGAYPAVLDPDSAVAQLYGTTVVSERHRHRYEFNQRYRPLFEAAGLHCSGLSPDAHLVEFIEMPSHPFFIATQGHPEFKSRPDYPHPLFVGLLGAALERSARR
jgi:CTP synthase